MKRWKCPACGAAYDGKVCKECLYEPFLEEIEPLPHEHRPSRPGTAAGESARGSVRRPAAASRKRSRRPQRTMSRFVCLILLLLSVAAKVIDAGWEILEEIEPEFEYDLDYDLDYQVDTDFEMPTLLDLTVNGTELFNQDGIRLLVDWREGPVEDGLTICLENNTDRDILATAGRVAINGRMHPEAMLYCEAKSGKAGMSSFWMGWDALEELGITRIERVDFVLEVAEAESYDPILTSQVLTFGPGGACTLPEPRGEEIWNGNGIRILYQGVGEDPYGNPGIRFYGENTSGEFLTVTSDEIMLDGELIGDFLWYSFLPDTCGEFYLYPDDYLSAHPDARLEQLQELEFALEILLGQDWQEEAVTDPIRVALQ